MNKMVESFENMNRRTKMILSVIGVSAVIVPAILLLVLSKTAKQEPQVIDSKRNVDAQNIENTVKSSPSVAPTPSPAQASASATPRAGTESAR